MGGSPCVIRWVRRPVAAGGVRAGRGACSVGVRDGAQTGGLVGGGPAVELDLEAEPVGQVAVVGQGDGVPSPASASRRTSSSGVPAPTSSSAASSSAATPAVIRLPDRGDPVALPLQGLPDAGLGGVGPAEPAGKGAGTHSWTRSSGAASTARTERLCRASPPSASRRLVRTAPAALVAEGDHAPGELPAGLGHRGRRVPEGARAPRVCENDPPVANQPEPCRLSTSPCSRSSSSARRTVTRLAPYRRPSTASLSRAPDSPRSPRAMRSRTSSAMVRNRAPVMNL